MSVTEAGLTLNALRSAMRYCELLARSVPVLSWEHWIGLVRWCPSEYVDAGSLYVVEAPQIIEHAVPLVVMFSKDEPTIKALVKGEIGRHPSDDEAAAFIYAVSLQKREEPTDAPE